MRGTLSVVSIKRIDHCRIPQTFTERAENNVLEGMCSSKLSAVKKKSIK